MTSKIKIALDCMGGDDAPTMVVRGADLAVERQPDLFFHLVGNEEAVSYTHLTLPTKRIV